MSRVLQVDKSLSEVLTDPSLLARCISAPALYGMRWFGGKDANVREVRAWDSAVLPPAVHATRDSPSLAYVLLMVEVGLNGPGGRRSSRSRLQKYFLPLVVRPCGQADGGEGACAEVGFFRTRDSNAVFCLLDGASDAGMTRSVIEAIRSRLKLPGRLGTFVFESTGLEAPISASEIAAASTNTIVTLDSRYVLKTFRRLEPGANLEVEIGAALATVGGQPHYTVPLAGYLSYLPLPRNATGAATTERVTLQLCQVYVHNTGSGWDHATGVLRRLYRHALVRCGWPESTPDAGRARSVQGTQGVPEDSRVRGILDEESAWAARLGESLARLHTVLARVAGDEFGPEPAVRRDVEDVVANMASRVTGPLARYAAGLGLTLDTEGLMSEVQEAACRVTDPGIKMRIHGDMHLGQILVCPDRFVFTDFEGEPVETLTARRKKRSPLRDLAGLLRSYAYAVQAALYEVAGALAEGGRLLAPWERSGLLELGRAWQRRVSDASTSSYVQVLRSEAPDLLPQSDDDIRATIRLLWLDRLVYEAIYEAANRPSWVRVPMSDLKDYLKETID